MRMGNNFFLASMLRQAHTTAREPLSNTAMTRHYYCCLIPLMWDDTRTDQILEVPFAWTG